MAVEADQGDERRELPLLVEREVVGLRRLAYARTGSWTASEDVVQDAVDAHRRQTGPRLRRPDGVPAGRALNWAVAGTAAGAVNAGP